MLVWARCDCLGVDMRAAARISFLLLGMLFILFFSVLSAPGAAARTLEQDARQGLDKPLLLAALCCIHLLLASAFLRVILVDSKLNKIL